MNLLEANKSNASVILKEHWSEYSDQQRVTIALVEKHFTEAAQIIIEDLKFHQSLTEKELTPQQIDAILGDVVTAMGDSASGILQRSGVNKAVGKTVKLGGQALTLSKDAVIAVDKKVNDLGKLVQQTEPVKNLDATVSKLQADIRSKLEQGPVGKEITGMVDKYAQFAKDNPVKSALIVGALTSVAAIAGGPLGGAAAGYLLRTTNGLLQGEKFSTASGKAIKTAAYGAIAGYAFNALSDWFNGIAYEQVPFDKQGITAIEVNMSKGFSSPTFSFADKVGTIYVPDDYAPIYQGYLENVKAGDMDSWNELVRYAQNIRFGDAVEWAASENDVKQAVAAANSEFYKNVQAIGDGIAAIAQGTTTAAAGNNIKPEDIKVDGEPAKESIDRMKELAGIQLDEFDLKGALKKVGGTIKKGASAVNKAAQDVGAMTPEKLKKAWQDAGAPTDDAGLYDFLKNKAGVPLDAIKTAYDNRALDINTYNNSADQGQETKPDAPKADTPNLTGKYATQGVDGDRIKTGTDAQQQDGGQQVTQNTDIQAMVKQIMALSDNEKIKIIQSLKPAKQESVQEEDLVLENMEDKTTYSLNISKHKDGTSMNSSITSDKPDELARILSLAGMADRMSTQEVPVPAPAEEEDYGCGEAVEVEENRLSKEKYYDTDYMVNDLAGGINGPKKMYKRASPGDNPMAVKEATDLKEEYLRYKASKNK